MEYSELLSLAEKQRQNSYSPYSGFSVGAALLCADGSIYTGCNIENAAFSPTICAERVAFFKAISEGKRDFSAIAIAGGKNGEDAFSPCAPCGVCRQVMSEFCNADFDIVLSDGNGGTAVYKLRELLPLGFELK